MKQDEEHLRLLSIFDYVVGGLTALAACFPFIHLAVGIALVSGAFPVPTGQQGPPPIVGWIFIATASVLILGGWTMAVAINHADDAHRRWHALVTGWTPTRRRQSDGRRTRRDVGGECSREWHSP